ncbi:vacuolar-sorting protein SNF8 [Ischnura elegans]|uniref:vacuolar-sorting protein SNF8 n=1 Tax=Ischnura elegans TaxID=197161 RepID=UPI001ED89628|nr:vacuolar-sorting protein SNF8 [Ischnura elegans]
MRRKAGIGGIQKHKLEQEKYRDKGTEIQENQLELMSKQLDVFRTNLEDFATKHRSEIKRSPQFRRQFQEMCASIGVDPLASRKGFWSVLGIGDFYYELGVQIVEVCLATNHRTGGLIRLSELRNHLVKARGKRKEHQDITCDDLLQAANKLHMLGSGFRVLPVGHGKKEDYLVQSVAAELSIDHTAVLELAGMKSDPSVNSGIAVTDVISKLKWEADRAKRALDYMVKEGLAWVDLQSTPEKTYWFPSLFSVNF